MKKIYLLIVLGVITLLTSCSNEVNFGEQYKKVVYIVNSKEPLFYAEHNVTSTSKGKISVYITGSELPGKDIRISYKVDAQALEEYNKKEYDDRTSLYFSLIPENLCSFQTPDITIKKGEPYGLLEFTLNTQALLANKVYILPITIYDAQDAEISENLHTILYVIQIQNEYAGDYMSTYRINGVGQGDIKKKATAISSKKILMPLAKDNKDNTSSNDVPDANNGYYQITVNEDNSATLEPYLQSIIHQDKEKHSYYDPDERIFYIYYNIEDKYGDYLPVEEILKAI